MRRRYRRERLYLCGMLASDFLGVRLGLRCLLVAHVPTSDQCLCGHVRLLWKISVGWLHVEDFAQFSLRGNRLQEFLRQRQI